MSEMSNARYDLGDGPRDRSLRVGDQERDAVSEVLRQRHLEGRLDAEEFQERIDRCLVAKTYAELDELIADFPGERAERRKSARRPRRRPWPLVFPLLPLVLILAIATGGHLAWLADPLLVFFVLRFAVWRPWGCGPRRFPRI
jgi:hypothetical protein